MPFGQKVQHRLDRRPFIGGSDARIIMGSNEAALIQLWRAKRGGAAPEDLSGNLIVQLGAATEELNRTWYERLAKRPISSMPSRLPPPVMMESTEALKRACPCDVASS